MRAGEGLRAGINALEQQNDLDAPIVFGWLLAGHQLGAGVSAFEAGGGALSARRLLHPCVGAGRSCIIAALLVLRTGRGTARDGLATATA
jgi:hypothetical protein